MSELRRQNGVGGFHRTSFGYKGSPLYNKQNRGFVGFAERRITEQDVPDYTAAGSQTLRDVTTYVQHRLAHPFIGRVAQRPSVLGADVTNLSQRLSHQEILYAHTSLFGGAVLYPFVARDMSREYLSGSVVSAGVTTSSLCFRTLSGDTCPAGGTILQHPTQHMAITRIGANLSSPTFTPSYWGHVPSRSISSERGSQTHVISTMTCASALRGQSPTRTAARP